MPGWMKRAGLAAVVSLVAVTPAMAAPDVVIVNGKVVTVDAAFAVAEAVAVEGGRITEVGTSARIRALADGRTRIVDAGGRTVIPGLIDNHTHLIRASLDWWRDARLDGVTSRSRALDIIAQRARTAKPGQWILVLGGWSEDQFTDEQKGFTRAELDRVAPDNPVLAQVLFARAYTNSKALAAAGIAKGSPEPKTGRIDRAADGEPTGVLRGGEAIGMVRAIATKQTEQRAEEGLKLVMADLNRVGITSVLDVGGFGLAPRHYEPVRALDKAGGLTVRFFHSLWTPSPTPEAAQKSIAQIKATKQLTSSDYFDLVGVGETLYRPAHDNLYGPTGVKPEVVPVMTDLMRAVAETGLHLHLHAQYDETITTFLDIIEGIDKQTPIRPLRWTLAHLDRISPASIERMKRLGIRAAIHSRPSIQGRMLAARYKDAALTMPPLRTIAQSGLLWGLGSDTAIVAPFNPFITLSWAVTGRMIGGATVLSEPVTRQQALVGHTRNNAEIILRGEKLGSIERGKLADLVMLDRDYLTVPDSDISGLRPVMTMVGGRIVHESK